MAEKKDDQVLATIELGTKYTAKIVLDNGFSFEVHMPSVQEEMLVYSRMKDIAVGMPLSNIQEEDAKILIRALATLDIVINSIETFDIVEGVRKYNKVNKRFWDWVSSFRNPNLLYFKMVIPLYTKYLEFYNSIEVSLDDLKKN